MLWNVSKRFGNRSIRAKSVRHVKVKMDWTNYMSPFLSFFLALIQFTLSELTPEQCRDMGFSVNLLCSSCDELKPFNLTESSLEQNCRKCCHADGQDEVAKRYSFGTLEVCN